MANAYLSLYLHLVFSTKLRAPLLAEAVRPRLFEYMAGIIRNTACIPIATGGIEDHVHVLMACHSEFRLGEFVKELKRSTNVWMKQEGVAPANFHWQRGYGAFSVSRWDVDKVAEYVRNQVEHHSRMTFEQEYVKLLKRHGVDYDERYLLD